MDISGWVARLVRPPGAGVEVGGDEFRRILCAPLNAENSSTPSHRFANEMGHPAVDVQERILA